MKTTSNNNNIETKNRVNNKPAYNVGNRVQRIGTGATGTIDHLNCYEGQRTYVVKYDQTQRRPSDGFEYQTEEVFANEITLQPAPEIKTIDVLQVGTMVRMPGVIGGLRVEEIDRKGDRVTCIDGSKEKHTYNSLEYFTATAEEIRIPEWLRICQYFYIGPKGVKTNRVLCTDIIPCSDQEKPVVIVYSDHEGKERKIFLSPGLDSVNRTDVERLTAKYSEQIVNDMQLGCGCMVGNGTESKKDSQWVKVRKAYTNDSLSPRDWTYCVCWYDVEPIDGDGYRETLRECENGVTLEQAARAMAIFEQEHRNAA